MKIGYISKRINDGKAIFKYVEGNGVRRIGVRSDTVKVHFLYGTIDYKELISNTELLYEGLMLVGEPFITNDETRTRCEKWCDWANNCKHREYSFFGEVEE